MNLVPKIPVFAITLPHADKKQMQIKERLQSLNIPFEFIEGVDGRLLSEEELQKVFDKEKSYNYYKWYRNRTGSAGVELSRGEIGCMLAHRKVFQKIVDENIDKAIVLEDDAFATEDFLPIVEKIIACLEYNSVEKNLIIKLDNTILSNYGVFIKLKNFLTYFLRPIQIKIDKELAIVKTVMNFGGAQGYYIDNVAARTFLNINYPVFTTSDEWNYFARFITVRALNKVIAPIKNMGSDIWSDGACKHISVPLKYRYIGIIKKMIIKIYLFLWR
jgi:glycosyl transferase family 25